MKNAHRRIGECRHDQLSSSRGICYFLSSHEARNRLLYLEILGGVFRCAVRVDARAAPRRPAWSRTRDTSPGPPSPRGARPGHRPPSLSAGRSELQREGCLLSQANPRARGNAPHGRPPATWTLWHGHAWGGRGGSAKTKGRSAPSFPAGTSRWGSIRPTGPLGGPSGRHRSPWRAGGQRAGEAVRARPLRPTP